MLNFNSVVVDIGIRGDFSVLLMLDFICNLTAVLVTNTIDINLHDNSQRVVYINEFNLIN